MKRNTLLVLSLFCCFCLLNQTEIPDDFLNSLEYRKLPAKEKMSILWDKITKVTEPLGFYGGLDTLNVIIQNNSVSFTHEGDIFPEGRRKLIHSVGVVAKMNIKITNKIYDGILGSGCTNGLIRLSTAIKYNSKKSSAEEAYENFIPGLAIKCLIDRAKSENILAMENVMGQHSWNFFEHPLTNSFKTPDMSLKIKVLASSFARVSLYGSSLGIYGLAHTDEHHKDILVDPKYPYRLEFQPNSELKKLFSKEYTRDFKEIIMEIPEGTKIYDIYAEREPGCNLDKIGEITLDSKFTTSRFGDEKLFFRHTRIEVDDEGTERSDYRDQYEMFISTTGKKPSGCPFGY